MRPIAIAVAAYCGVTAFSLLACQSAVREARPEIGVAGESAVASMPLRERLGRWAKLRRGMKYEAVKALLGEPIATDALAGVEFWMYQEPVYVSPGTVLFEYGRVSGWRSPTR